MTLPSDPLRWDFNRLRNESAHRFNAPALGHLEVKGPTMIRVLAAVLALCLSLPASAACVWSATSTWGAKVVCADGDEVAPTLVTEGLSLAGPAFYAAPVGFVVVAEADSGQTITSGTIKAYLWDPNVAAWARVPELDLTIPVAGERRVSWAGFEILSPLGRIAYVPSTVTLSSGGITIYVTAGR